MDVDGMLMFHDGSSFFMRTPKNTKTRLEPSSKDLNSISIHCLMPIPQARIPHVFPFFPHLGKAIHLLKPWHARHGTTHGTPRLPIGTAWIYGHSASSTARIAIGLASDPPETTWSVPGSASKPGQPPGSKVQGFFYAIVESIYRTWFDIHEIS